MSISYTKVENSPVLKKATFYSAKDFCRVTIDPATKNHLSLPSDYQFSECFLSRNYLTFADRVLNFKIYPDDVWITSFPKSGTTWIMNVVWQLKNNLDFVRVVEPPFMFLERALLYDLNDENKNDQEYLDAKRKMEKQLDEYEQMAPSRILKSHFPAYLLPRDIWRVKPKLIYIFRDAKDVAVSMYHMYKNHLWLRYSGTIEDSFDAFLNDHIVYGPFYDHVNNFRQLSELDHVLLIKYEDMLANPFAEVKKMSEFLNCSYTDDQLQQLTEFVSFENMRTRKQDFQSRFSNGFNFYRKGRSGSYREEMTPEYVQVFDEWERQKSGSSQ